MNKDSLPHHYNIMIRAHKINITQQYRLMYSLWSNDPNCLKMYLIFLNYSSKCLHEEDYASYIVDGKNVSNIASRNQCAVNTLPATVDS